MDILNENEVSGSKPFDENNHESSTGKIFVLGDSRTGTMTVHRFFETLRIKSIHWYVNQSGQLKPPHEHIEENWRLTKLFIETSGYRAFSDYPTRTYYKDLLATYPDAFFILTTRRDLETWQKSMINFFAKFDMPLDMVKLSENYLRVNEKIRSLAKVSGVKFLEVCIDDGAQENSKSIKRFLNIQSTIVMGWENATSSYDNSIASKRSQFFNPTTDDIIGYVESLCNNSKAMPSEYGWLNLINDANDFLRYQYGIKTWAETDRQRAVDVVTQRERRLRSLGIAFQNIIVPEKSIVYPEYMPRAFSNMKISEARPAVELVTACPGISHYLADYLNDLKSYGLLYFRGDTHTNWLGAYFVYRYVVEQMNRTMLQMRNIKPSSIIAAIPLSELEVHLAEYNGDLHAQLLEKHLSEYQNVWKYLQPARSFEQLLRYVLPPSKLMSHAVPAPAEYDVLATARPLIVREGTNSALPRAVIFRDSVADFMIELLAQHFSRSVFVWYKGLVVEDVIERERPDIVLHLSAERFTWIYAQQPAFSNLETLRTQAASKKKGESLDDE